jgi:GT2 family glycosyltransferase
MVIYRIPISGKYNTFPHLNCELIVPSLPCQSTGLRIKYAITARRVVYLIDIVVITYNSIGVIENCLNSIMKHTFLPKRVIVVDNGSTDQTAPYLSSRTDIIPILGKENLGYAKAVNKGISSGNGEFIVILNDDTEVTSGWLKPLIDCLQDSKVAIVAPKLINHSGHLVGVGTDWDWKLPYFMQPNRQGILEGERDCLSINGACFLIKRSLLPIIGLLDENYFFYFEETDYCLNANYLGYRVVFCGKSTIYHDYKLDSVRRAAISANWKQSEMYFNKKWGYNSSTRTVRKSDKL